MLHRSHTKLAALSSEAAQWFVQLRDDDLRFADELRYLRWLKASPSHIAEMLRICRLYAVLKHKSAQVLACVDQRSAVADIGASRKY